jgi:hypothetical protein
MQEMQAHNLDKVKKRQLEFLRVRQRKEEKQIAFEKYIYQRETTRPPEQTLKDAATEKSIPKLHSLRQQKPKKRVLRRKKISGSVKSVSNHSVQRLNAGAQNRSRSPSGKSKSRITAGVLKAPQVLEKSSAKGTVLRATGDVEVDDLREQDLDSQVIGLQHTGSDEKGEMDGFESRGNIELCKTMNALCAKVERMSKLAPSVVTAENECVKVQDLDSHTTEFQAVADLIEAQNTFSNQKNYRCQRVLKVFNTSTINNTQNSAPSRILFFGSNPEQLEKIVFDGFNSASCHLKCGMGLVFSSGLSVSNAEYRKLHVRPNVVHEGQRAAWRVLICLVHGRSFKSTQSLLEHVSNNSREEIESLQHDKYDFVEWGSAHHETVLMSLSQNVLERTVPCYLCEYSGAL